MREHRDLDQLKLLAKELLEAFRAEDAAAAAEVVPCILTAPIARHSLCTMRSWCWRALMVSRAGQICSAVRSDDHRIAGRPWLASQG